jgi:hypothetical protein
LQAVWKHRAAFMRNKAMGLFALPNILIFQMLLPLVSPFIDVMFLAGVGNYFIVRYYHAEAASAAIHHADPRATVNSIRGDRFTRFYPAKLDGSRCEETYWTRE